MKLYFTKTPTIIQKIFSNYSWRFSSQEKELFLTFDDGPTPKITEFVLTELKKYNAYATFFCIGKNIKNHPEIAQQIIADGHAIGNHTMNHVNGFKTKKDDYLKNTELCEKIISNEFLRNHNATKRLKLFRPPYGKIKNNQAKKLIDLGYKIIMYDVLSADFDTNIFKEKCLQDVLRNTTKGSIIVFHDSIKASQNLMFTLPQVLAYFSKKGFTFKAIS